MTFPEATYQRWFEAIAALVLCHSPSGHESAIDRALIAEFERLGVAWQQDPAGNLIVKLAGKSSDRAVAITAHKDEIGAIVKTIEPTGRVHLRRLGGSFPWIYGEGPIDLLGDRATVTGILSFGSRHVSDESPQKALQEGKAVTWETAWVETGWSAADLAIAGVRPGSRAVVGLHRKAPLRLGMDGEFIASYCLDNKAALAIMLDLLGRGLEPAVDTYLIASAKEEVGAIGALYFSQNQRLDALVALEIAPIAPEYPIVAGSQPVLLAQDGYGLYDDALNTALSEAGEQIGLAVQWGAIAGFGSDASIVMKFGHVPRAACLGFPTDNTHGYEIAHLGGVIACADLLAAWLVGDPLSGCEIAF